MRLSDVTTAKELIQLNACVQLQDGASQKDRIFGQIGYCGEYYVCWIDSDTDQLQYYSLEKIKSLFLSLYDVDKARGNGAYKSAAKGLLNKISVIEEECSQQLKKICCLRYILILITQFFLKLCCITKNKLDSIDNHLTQLTEEEVKSNPAPLRIISNTGEIPAQLFQGIPVTLIKKEQPFLAKLDPAIIPLPTTEAAEEVDQIGKISIDFLKAGPPRPTQQLICLQVRNLGRCRTIDELIANLDPQHGLFSLVRLLSVELPCLFGTKWELLDKFNRNYFSCYLARYLLHYQIITRQNQIVTIDLSRFFGEKLIIPEGYNYLFESSVQPLFQALKLILAKWHSEQSLNSSTFVLKFHGRNNPVLSLKKVRYIVGAIPSEIDVRNLQFENCNVSAWHAVGTTMGIDKLKAKFREVKEDFIPFAETLWGPRARIRIK